MVNFMNFVKPKFVGIVEHVRTQPSYDYCILNQDNGHMAGAVSLETIAELIAGELGEKFQQRITYQPPRGVDMRGTERGLCPSVYHQLSVLEQDRFEKEVLRISQKS